MSDRTSADQSKAIPAGIANALAAAIDRNDGSLPLVAAISVVQLKKLV